MDFGDIRASDLLDTLQIGVVVHSCDSSVLYANPKALELLRITSEQALGRSAYDSDWRFVDRYGAEMPPPDYPVNQVLSSKIPLKDLQAGILDSSGRITWVNCNAYPELRPDGEIDRIIVNFIDITESKEAIPYKDIVALSKDAIIVTEAKTIEEPGPKILYANQAFYQLTGYSKEEVIGNNPRMMQGDQTSPQTRQRIREALTKKLSVRVTILNYRKDGTPYWNELSLFPLTNNYDEVTFFVGVQRDASVRKKREEAVNLSNRKLHDRNLELKKINEQKNQILGIVAHDLRNPLYTLTTSFGLVSEFVNNNDSELFEIIDASLKNMNAIIEDLVESQALHTAEISTSKEIYLLDELIHDVTKLNFQNAKKKAITIRIQVSKEIKACFDYGKLQRALDNLLSNAIKFSPCGSEVTIGYEVIDDEKVRIFVHDNGPGLTEDDKTRVFAPFQRLSAQPTADESSTGLGLSIVKRIAQLHGGDAGVISEYLKGAKFYLDLPT
ncbi:MAG TPA: PAS domain-containing protein [Opitutales bacterium]|nr:PAS domain-containing protein [Opitutales bacterium]